MTTYEYKRQPHEDGYPFKVNRRQVYDYVIAATRPRKGNEPLSPDWIGDYLTVSYDGEKVIFQVHDEVGKPDHPFNARIRVWTKRIIRALSKMCGAFKDDEAVIRYLVQLLNERTDPYAGLPRYRDINTEVDYVANFTGSGMSWLIPDSRFDRTTQLIQKGRANGKKALIVWARRNWYPNYVAKANVSEPLNITPHRASPNGHLIFGTDEELQKIMRKMRRYGARTYRVVENEFGKFFSEEE